MAREPDKIIGYFNWRIDLRGQPQPEKILKEHVDFMAAAYQWRYNNVYKSRLIQSIPLTKHQWGVSLNALARQRPCPMEPDRAPK